MSLVADSIRQALLRLNRFTATLENWRIVTYEDKARLRAPYYHRRILFDREGQDRIGELIARNAPLMVARLGSVELSCLRFYLLKRGGKNPPPYGDRIRFTMSNNAGFFPADDDSLDAFAELYLDRLRRVDVLGVWFNRYEDVICNDHCRDAELVEIGCLEPFRFSNPWSAGLAGKKVLVVHPFAESIRNQYTEKREMLFADPGILPEFELKTIRAVQSIAGSKVEFATWFDACRHMCAEVAKVDFDICLIGAGAYGLPLASFVKELGKQAIHMGGATQILFGIKGRRWEQLYADSTAKLFNEQWIRPLKSETPADKDKVEKGCYW